MKPTLKFEIFRGMLCSFEDLFNDAAKFATSVGRDSVLSISHSEDRNDGVVTVWYWSR